MNKNEEEIRGLQLSINRLKFGILEIPLTKQRNGNVKIDRCAWDSLEALAESTKDSYEKSN